MTVRWRAGRALRLPCHRASSMSLAGAYPFLATPALTSGVYVGSDALSGAPFCFDPWSLYADGLLTNPNMLLAGVIGQGKSALAKSLAVRSIAVGRRVYVPGDPKGEWAAVARALGGKVISLGPGLPTRLNPLEVHGSRTTTSVAASAARAGQLRLLASLTETTLGRSIHPREHTALDAALTSATRNAKGSPTIPHVIEALLEPDSHEATLDACTVADRVLDGREASHGLRRLVRGDLAGLFDGPSTEALDDAAPIVVLDLSRLGSHEDAVAVAMACTSAWLEGSLTAGGGPRWIVYDEAWRLLRSLPLVRRMQAQWKLSRAYGVANLLILHRLSDLDSVGAAGSEVRALAEGLLADCSTRVVYRQETDQLAGVGKSLGLTATERQLLPAVQRGTGLWKVANRSYLVHHHLHPEEAEVFDTDSSMRGNGAA